MTFECSNCQLRYRIDDSLVPPEGARVKCRRCSAIIEVPAPVIELAPVDLELIPPPPVKGAPRPEAPSAEPAREPERVSPQAMPSEPAAEGGGVTLEQQLAAEARSVPPSPDIEHDSYEHFQAPAAADLPADPVFEHIGVATAQEDPAGAIEPAAPALDSAPAVQPAPVPEPGTPAFEPVSPVEQAPAQPAHSVSPAPSLEPSPPPAFEAPAPTLEPALALSSGLGAPTLEVEPPRLDVAALAPAPHSPPPPLAPAPQLAPAPTAAPEPPVAPAPEPGGAEAPPSMDNVVPLTLGTPIPEGLSAEERTRHEKARRLARVLASDIAIYNREKKERGMAEGNLVAVLGYEIKKSWETYKERVGADFANSTPYFRDALNDLLAEGKKIF